MDTGKSLSIVREVYEKYKDDGQRLVRELKKLIKEGHNSGDMVIAGASYGFLADVCRDNGDTGGVLANSIKAAELLKNTTAYGLLIKAYLSLSYAYGTQDNNQMALAACDRAYRVVKTHRIKGRYRIAVLNNLANCYHILGEFRTSVGLLTECVKHTREEFPDDYDALAMRSINLANNYKYDGDVQKAREILDGMEPWIGRVSYVPMVCDYYLRRAIIFYALDNIETANANVDKSLACVPSDTFPQPLYADLMGIAGILIQLKDKERAKRIVDLMTVYAEKCKGTAEQIYAYRTLAGYYHAFGESEKALSCYEQLNGLYDKRMEELTGVQARIYKGMKHVDLEITKLRKDMRKTEELYSQEPMTKLLNRAALLKISSEFIETAKKKRQKIGVIFIDIDCFKECNDTYGHAKGDEIIKLVAGACKDEESSNIRFARYGGDEFFGITHGLTDDEITEIARRICRRIRKENIPNEKNPNGGIITLSVGLVNVGITANTDTIIGIANYADKAVYHAKDAGRNTIFFIRYDFDEKDNLHGSAEYTKIDF